MAADRMGGMSPAPEQRPQTPFMDRATSWSEAEGRGRRLETMLLIVQSHLTERGNHGDSAAIHYARLIYELLES